jgi:hypothetical protein
MTTPAIARPSPGGVLMLCLLSVLLVPDARGGAPEDFGNAHVTLAVTPDEGLGATNAVSVSGAGFHPSQVVSIAQCSALLGQGAHGPSEVVCGTIATILADDSGNFGPVVVTVNRSFSGTTGGSDPQPAVRTCAPTDDCVIYAISGSDSGSTNGVRYGYHHLNFAN